MHIPIYLSIYVCMYLSICPQYRSISICLLYIPTCSGHLPSGEEKQADPVLVPVQLDTLNPAPGPIYTIYV